MNSWRRHFQAVAAGLAIAAVTAPVGLANDLRSPDTRDAADGRIVTSVSTDLRSPDTRDAANGRSVEMPIDLRSPDARDAADGRIVSETPTAVVAVDGPGGFDWIDAGVGAATAFGLSLLAAGLFVLGQQYRKDRLAAA